VEEEGAYKFREGPKYRRPGIGGGPDLYKFFGVKVWGGQTKKGSRSGELKFRGPERSQITGYPGAVGPYKISKEVIHESGRIRSGISYSYGLKQENGNNVVP